jgi:hypothetical protein
MIVLALLAFLVAIVWPSLRRPLQRSTVHEAAVQLVKDLGQARLNAVETGLTMMMRYELGGSRYLIGPADVVNDPEAEMDEFLEEDASDLSTAGASGRDDEPVKTDMPGASSARERDSEGVPLEQLIWQGTLEDGVIFEDPATVQEELDIPLGSALGEMLADERAETEEVEPLVQDDAETQWSTPVLLYATGRAENAEIRLSSSDGYRVTVTVRGLTGAVKIGPLEHDVRSVEQREEGRQSRPERDRDYEPAEPSDSAEDYR